MNALQTLELEDMPEQQERERFRIQTIDQVNWALRKLAAIKAKREEIISLAEAEIDRINTWRDKEIRSLDRSSEFFESLLHEYMVEQRARDPKFKKASTPYGSVKFHKLPAKWEYQDEKLVESLKSIGRDDLIRIKEEPNKAELKKVASVKDGQVIDPESGAVIEGVAVIEQGETVEVEIS